MDTVLCMASTSQNASIISRNLSASMRDNYEQHGVAEVHLTSFEKWIKIPFIADAVLQESQCNISESPLPRYPSMSILVVQSVWCFIESFFSGRAQTLRVSRWWQTHSSNTATIRQRLGQIMFFDMACGSLIYYIIYIKPLPEVSSSCQAGRSCLPLS
jgi:hypothetical protein